MLASLLLSPLLVVLLVFRWVSRLFFLGARALWSLIHTSKVLQAKPEPGTEAERRLVMLPSLTMQATAPAAYHDKRGHSQVRHPSAASSARRSC